MRAWTKHLIGIPAANFTEHIAILLSHPKTVAALGDGGIDVTIKSREVICERGEMTSPLPGKLLRFTQAAPAA